MANNQKHPELDQIQAFLDHELDDREAGVLQEHLQRCSICQEKLSQLESLVTRLEALPEIDLNKDLSTNIVESLQESKRLARGLTWTLVLEAVAAGVMISLMIPALQAASWLPSLAYMRQNLLTALNVFLSQLASSWMVWWAEWQLSLKSILQSLVPQTGIAPSIPSPWIIILSAGGLVILINFLLLRFSPLEKHNQRS